MNFTYNDWLRKRKYVIEDAQRHPGTQIWRNFERKKLKKTLWKGILKIGHVDTYSTVKVWDHLRKIRK